MVPYERECRRIPDLAPPMPAPELQLTPATAFGRWLLGNPVPNNALRLLPPVALAPFVNGVNEVPFSKVTMLLSSHPPNDCRMMHADS